MRLKYLGPLVFNNNHVPREALDCTGYALSCFAVEVGCEAVVDGPVIEGDVLVVNEAQYRP